MRSEGVQGLDLQRRKLMVKSTLYELLNCERSLICGKRSAGNRYGDLGTGWPSSQPCRDPVASGQGRVDMIFISEVVIFSVSSRNGDTNRGTLLYVYCALALLEVNNKSLSETTIRKVEDGNSTLKIDARLEPSSNADHDGSRRKFV